MVHELEHMLKLSIVLVGTKSRTRYHEQQKQQGPAIETPEGKIQVQQQSNTGR